MKRKRCKRCNKSKNKKVRRKAKKNDNLGFPEIVLYAVLNTDINLDQGAAAAAIASSIISLYSQIDSNAVQTAYIDQWQYNGKQIIILNGYDNKHLRYLQEEAKYVAIASHTLYQRWSRGQVILVLSAFGEKQELDELFGELSYLR